MSTKFKPVLNEQTGKTDFNFSAELKSLGTKVFKNTNETEYVLGTIDFTYPNGKPAIGVNTQIFAKSLAHGIKVGSMLLSTLSRDDNGAMWIRTSHLIAGNNVDTDALGSLFDEVEANIGAEA